MTDPMTTPEDAEAMAAWLDMAAAPRDRTWFWAETANGQGRWVHFADRSDRYPIDHTDGCWSTEPVRWRPTHPDLAALARLREADRAEIERLTAENDRLSGLMQERSHMLRAYDAMLTENASREELWKARVTALEADRVKVAETALRMAADAYNRPDREWGVWSAAVRAILAITHAAVIAQAEKE